MQNDVNCCDISLSKILIGVGGMGHGWVGVGLTGVGWYGSYRGRMGWVMEGWEKHDYKIHIYHDHQKFLDNGTIK